MIKKKAKKSATTPRSRSSRESTGTKSTTRLKRAHGGLDRAKERLARAEAKLMRAEQRVERALRQAAADLENRVVYAADGANESTSSEVNLLTAAGAAIASIGPGSSRRRASASRRATTGKPATSQSSPRKSTARKPKVTKATPADPVSDARTTTRPASARTRAAAASKSSASREPVARKAAVRKPAARKPAGAKAPARRRTPVATPATEPSGDAG